MKKKILPAFSLIELMVVMGLMGFLFGALFSSYLQIQELVHEQSTASQKNIQALTAVKAISDDINNLYYLNWEPRSFFRGVKANGFGSGTSERCDTLNFISSTLYSNSSLLQSRTYSVTYFTATEEASGDLILYRQEDTFVDYTRPSFGIPVPILKSITRFEVQYSTNLTTWKDDWNAKNARSAPRYIKFNLGWKEGSKIRDFVFTVSPPIVFLR